MGDLAWIYLVKISGIYTLMISRRQRFPNKSVKRNAEKVMEVSEHLSSQTTSQSRRDRDWTDRWISWAATKFHRDDKNTEAP